MIPLVDHFILPWTLLEDCYFVPCRVFTDKLTSLGTVCTWFVYGVTTSEMKYYFSVVFIQGNIYKNPTPKLYRPSFSNNKKVPPGGYVTRGGRYRVHPSLLEDIGVTLPIKKAALCLPTQICNSKCCWNYIITSNSLVLHLYLPHLIFP